mmetsp:Transcript_21310/g.72165  ORF Transcript_21310/g.72165 Transcript_21310/m.72165 type:complete len:626 (-) Transcript_21310:75-1952(-)
MAWDDEDESPAVETVGTSSTCDEAPEVHSCELRALGEATSGLDELEFWLEGVQCASGAARRASACCIAAALAKRPTQRLARAHGILQRVVDLVVVADAADEAGDAELALAAAAAAFVASEASAASTRLTEAAAAAISRLLDRGGAGARAAPEAPGPEKKRRGFFAKRRRREADTASPPAPEPETESPARASAPPAAAKALEAVRAHCTDRAARSWQVHEWRRRWLNDAVLDQLHSLEAHDFATLVVLNALRSPGAGNGASSAAAANRALLRESGALAELCDRAATTGSGALAGLRAAAALEAAGAACRTCAENVRFVSREAPRLAPAVVRQIAEALAEVEELRTADAAPDDAAPAGCSPALLRCATALSTLVDITHRSRAATEGVGTARGMPLLLNAVEICRRVQDAAKKRRQRRRATHAAVEASPPSVVAVDAAVDDDGSDDGSDEARDADEAIAFEAQLLALSALANCVEDDVENCGRLAAARVGHMGGCEYLVARVLAATSDFGDELRVDAARCNGGGPGFRWRVADLVHAAHLAFPLASVAVVDDEGCRSGAAAALAAAGASKAYVARLLESFVALHSTTGAHGLSPAVVQACVALVRDLRAAGDDGDDDDARGDADDDGV